jgi:hypothetical protein
MVRLPRGQQQQRDGLCARLPSRRHPAQVHRRQPALPALLQRQVGIVDLSTCILVLLQYTTIWWLHLNSHFGGYPAHVPPALLQRQVRTVKTALSQASWSRRVSLTVLIVNMLKANGANLHYQRQLRASNSAI